MLASRSLCGAAAQDFYKGKEITIYTGSPPGGPYDAYARLVARHMGPPHPGQSEHHRAVHAGRQRPAHDGLHAEYRAQGRHRDRRAAARAAFDPLTEPISQFDAQAFHWLGSANNEVNLCIVWHTTPFQTIDDVYKRELVVGTSGPTSTDSVYPNVINNLFGTKFKVVTGYKGAAEANIAIERGEVDGRCGISWDTLVALHQEWLREKKIRLLVQIAMDKHPELPDVPSVFDLAKTDEQRQILASGRCPTRWDGRLRRRPARRRIASRSCAALSSAP